MFSEFVKDAAITLASIFRNRVLTNGTRVDFSHNYNYIHIVKKFMVMIKSFCYLSLFNDRELKYLARVHYNNYTPNINDLNNITYLTAMLLIPYHRIWDKNVNNRPWLYYVAQQAKVNPNYK